MDLHDLVLLLAAFTGWATASFGWWQWLVERAENRRAQAAKVRAENELLLIRRRASDQAPYLVPSVRPFGVLYLHGDEPGQVFGIAAGDGDTLGYLRKEVERDMPAGREVLMMVDNQGRNAHEVSVKLEGEAVRLTDLECDSGERFMAIAYPYAPERHGSVQTLEISFLAANGLRDVHRYHLTHGKAALVRIDPA